MLSKKTPFMPQLAACLLLALDTAAAAYCHGKPSPSAQPNLHPIQSGAPKLLGTVPNGVLQSVGEGDETIRVVHVWGTPYERGLAHGQLVAKQVKWFVPAAMQYFVAQFAEALNGTVPWIPPAIADEVARLGRSTRCSTRRRSPPS